MTSKKKLIDMIKAQISKMVPLATISSYVKDMDIIRLNIKNMGYDIARQLQPVLTSVNRSFEPTYHGLVSKPTTQADIESPWFSYWCSEIDATPIYHRKLWEFAFILQTLFEHRLLRDGIEGIGFGCGQEPLASYFATKRMIVCVTDLESELVEGMGWAETGQHATEKERAFHPNIVSRDIFDKQVDHRYVDMNNIPDFGERFDFCWSVCAMEHLGSIKKGLDFVENSLSVLKPGGIAIHTTEYNYLSDDKTIDNWITVLFQRKHFEELASKLAEKGHLMLGPNFDTGTGVLDRFIDVPPFFDEKMLSYVQRDNPAHLKLSIDGFASTCFGVIVRKSG